MAAGGTRRHPRRLRYTDFSLPLSRLENRNFIARWDQGEGTRAVGEEKGSAVHALRMRSKEHEKQQSARARG